MAIEGRTSDVGSLQNVLDGDVVVVLLEDQSEQRLFEEASGALDATVGGRCVDEVGFGHLLKGPLNDREPQLREALFQDKRVDLSFSGRPAGIVGCLARSAPDTVEA